MACIPATGPCSLAADGRGCNLPKEYSASILVPTVIFVQGLADGVTIQWDANVSYADQVMTIVARDQNGLGPYAAMVEVPRDDGVATITPIVQGTAVDIFLVPSNSFQFGEAALTLGIADASWDSTADVVYHEADIVQHGTDTVLYT